MRHTIALFGAALLTAGALAWGTSAHAQEENYFQRAVPAPSQAFELRVGTGYTQGFGSILPYSNIANVAGPGIGFDLGLAYRVDPRWSVGLQGGYQEFGSEVNTAARGMNADVGVTYHADAFRHGDPWVRVATGYRGLWSVNPPGLPTTYVDGWELARAQVGYDVRVSDDVAIAPEIGVDLTMFVNQVQSGTSMSQAAQLGTFVSAGLQGRFDVGGRKVAGPATVAEAVR